MIKVLFICAANINRSAMAEALFRKIIKEAGLTDKIQSISAAVGNGHVGKPLFWRARRILRKNGVPFDGIFAHQVTKDDIETSKYIIVMDDYILKRLREIGYDIPVNMMTDFIPESGLKEIPDPSYTNDYEGVYKLIYEGCINLLNIIKIEEKY